MGEYKPVDGIPKFRLTIKNIAPEKGETKTPVDIRITEDEFKQIMGVVMSNE